MPFFTGKSSKLSFGVESRLKTLIELPSNEPLIFSRFLNIYDTNFGVLPWWSCLIFKCRQTSISTNCSFVFGIMRRGVKMNLEILLTKGHSSRALNVCNLCFSTVEYHLSFMRFYELAQKAGHPFDTLKFIQLSDPALRTCDPPGTISKSAMRPFLTPTCKYAAIFGGDLDKNITCIGLPYHHLSQA